MAAANPQLDLDALEDRAYRDQFQDGLPDLILGLFLGAFSASFLLDAGGMGGIWGAVLIPLWLPLHRRLAEGRTGYVEFGPGRRAKVRRKQLFMTLALGMSVLAGLGMWAYHALGGPEGFGDWLRPLGPLPLAFSLTALIVVGAALLQLRRGFAYAALVLGFSIIGHLVGDAMFVGLLAAAVVVTAWGVVVLLRFLREHPVVDAGGAGNGG